MRATAKLEGDKELLRQFARLKALNLRGAKEATKQAVEAMLEQMRTKAPKRTGLLASSIGVVGQPVGRDWFMLYAGVKAVFYPPEVFRHKKRKMDTATVARWIEDGTKFMQPRPFIVPALKAYKGSLLTIINAELNKAITTAIAGGKRA